MDTDKIGKFIYELRTEKGLSQYQLADMIPISRQAVSKWERGQAIPDSPVLLKLSEIFNVSINELLIGERESKNSVKQLENVALNIVDENIKKSRVIRKTFIVFISIITTLLTLFLTYYFINSYNSIKVYKLYGQSKNFDLVDGIYIVTRQKTYLKLGNIKTKNNENILSVKLYYKIKNEDILIQDDIDINTTVIDLYGYSSDINNHNIKKILDNTYIEIKYNDDNYEKIKIKYHRDFVNNNLFFPKTEKIYKSKITPVMNIEEYEELINNVIEKITEKDKKDNNNYRYVLNIEKNKLEFAYYEKQKQIKYIINDNEIFNYYISSKTCISNENDCMEEMKNSYEKYLK